MGSSAFVPSAPIEGLPIGAPPLPLEGEWSDDQAKKIVKSDFQLAETFRQQNIEPRWIQSDRTYLAWQGGAKTWEGTRIPRANMQVYLAYQNIEVLMTQVIDAIFGQDLSFDVQPGSATTTIAQAHAVRNLIMDQFARLNCGAPNFISLREIYQRMKKEAFIYGNGICEFGWEDSQKTKDVYARGPISPYVDAVYNGMTIRVPAVGPPKMAAYSTPTEYSESKPFLVHRSIKDFYIDPNTPSPSVQEARYCASRTLMPISKLQAYRDKEGFKIPSDERLFELSKKVIVTSGDMLKQMQDSYQGYNSQPTLNQSVDPRLAQVEVVRYWQKDHHVWLLGREEVALNRANPYGVLPFLGTYYTSVPNRFYALSVCDLCEGDQNLAVELINGRLDELNLILHPPIIRKRGSFLATSAAKFRPGGSFEVDSPKDDIVRMEMGNVTQEAFVEVDQVERRTAKTIGVADTTGFGVSSAGGNSALRSATGVQTQANAQSARVHYQVANDEDQFFLPLLNIFWGLNKLHLDPQQMIQLTGQPEPIDPVEVLNADPRFTMETASKMKGRAAMQGGGLNVFFQGLLNPSVTELASEQQNLVPDFAAISELFCDTFNQKATSFYRPMTPQEQQARQQKMMAPLQAKAQLQQDRLNAMSADAQGRDETDLIIKVLDVLQKSGVINNLADVKRDVEIMGEQKKLANGR
jgi:hypothetical protein